MSQVKLVASGKGGVGKSTLSAFIAGALVCLGKRVLIIELDSGLRSLDIMLAVSERAVFDLSDILLRGCEPEKAIVKGDRASAPDLIPAALNRGFMPKPEELREVCNKLSERYDFILLDTPAGLSGVLDSAIGAADGALVVVTPDPIAIRDAHSVASVILDSGIKDIKLIINRIPQRQKSLVVNDLDEVIDRVGVQLIGAVLEDNMFPQCAAEGRMLSEGSTSLREIQNIADRMCGRYIPLQIR